MARPWNNIPMLGPMRWVIQNLRSFKPVIAFSTKCLNGIHWEEKFLKLQVFQGIVDSRLYFYFF